MSQRRRYITNLSPRQRNAICRVMFHLRERDVPAADVGAVWGVAPPIVYRYAVAGRRSARLGSRA